ncbi:MAG TPA: orotate phosphoribosyltransferase [Gemmatimonadales bacterium]
MTAPDRLERLLLERSVQRGEFILSSGLKSSYYLDCRPTTMSAEGLALVGQLGLDAIRRVGWKPDAIGGLTMGADPVAYAVAAASWGSPPPIDAFSVRKEAKGHGTKRQVEGNFRSGFQVVVVEDVITTGGSALQAIEVLRGAGAQILGVLAVVDREQGGKSSIEKEVATVVSLTTASRLGLASSG